MKDKTTKLKKSWCWIMWIECEGNRLVNSEKIVCCKLNGIEDNIKLYCDFNYQVVYFSSRNSEKLWEKYKEICEILTKSSN